jgi:endonuclease/exonuclease/phosphatase family metal-dependent hydrolase
VPHINVVTCNFEDNGAGDSITWEEMHSRLCSLNPHLLFRQEMWGTEIKGKTLGYIAERALGGMRGWLGEGVCTALFIDPAVFTPLREWHERGELWTLPPTALTLRLEAAGAEAIPLVAASFHLNYASPTRRQSEAEALTMFADKQWRTARGMVRLPALMGGDRNSYSVPEATPGDPELPRLGDIQDQRHRVHRSHYIPDGRRRMDIRPDEILRAAGLTDLARYAAVTQGAPKTVAPTVNASATHGPATRIDAIYGSAMFQPAVIGAEVIDMTGLSDHHTVLIRLDSDVLADILRQAAQLDLAA